MAAGARRFIRAVLAVVEAGHHGASAREPGPLPVLVGQVLLCGDGRECAWIRSGWEGGAAVGTRCPNDLVVADRRRANVQGVAESTEPVGDAATTLIRVLVDVAAEVDDHMARVGRIDRPGRIVGGTEEAVLDGALVHHARATGVLASVGGEIGRAHV